MSRLSGSGALALTMASRAVGEYTTIDKAALETDGANEEPAEQSMLPATNDDLDDDNLNAEHDDTEVDDNVNDDNLNADHDDDVPLCFCSINGILRTARFVPHALVAEDLDVVSSDEPTSFAEAERNPSWRKVMMEEMTSVEENDTWSLIDLPPSCKLIRVKWVLKVKRDEHGVASKHKACLVVKGYVQ
jgi:hypothetical protein